MGFHGIWVTIPWACMPSVMSIKEFKSIHRNPAISPIQRTCSFQRYSYRSSRHIRQDVEEGSQPFRRPSANIIDYKPELWDEGMPMDGTCQSESVRIQDDQCALGWPLLTNGRIQDIPPVSSVLRITKTFIDKSCSFNMLKTAILTGIFSLQDSHHAWASTDIQSAVRSFSWLGDFGDISTGFTSAFLLIFFSELGDKTFFIAALLASRKSSAAVFIGTFSALAVMTVISVFLGRTFHYVDGILPFRLGETELPLDDLAAVALLVYFGVSTLLDASSSDQTKTSGEQEEAELAIAGLSGDGAGILAAANTVIGTFALVFVAEWGDKSFFSTIALAAASSPLGVVGGAVVGHGVATLIAVLGGSLLGTYLSEKVIAYTGGILFLIFAATTLLEIFV